MLKKNFGQIFFINVSAFGILGITLLLSHLFPDNASIRFLKSLVILFAIFPLTGLNFTLIIEKWFNQDFDIFERLTILSLFSFTLQPLFLLVERTLLGALDPNIPFLNTAISFLLVNIFYPFGLEKVTSKSNSQIKQLRYSFILAGFIFSAIFIGTVSVYYPLPESDPYYWLTKIQNEITAGALPSGGSYRPLLSYLVYPIVTTASIDLYAFFKYLMPCMFFLALFPASLIARQSYRTIEQLAILLLPLSSASIITYFLLPIPQALVNLILTFFIFLSLHAVFSKNNFFYFLSGISLLVGYLYHDILILFFLPWLLITILFWRNQIWKKIKHHKLITTILLLSIIPYLHSLSPIFNFFKNWLVRIGGTIGNLESNFLFPLSYVNIDGRIVGWGSWLGVAKYYIFYGGPLLLITIAFFFFITIYSIRHRQSLQTHLYRWQTVPLLIIFLFFFSLAEIFPRFFNIALLPERALGFAGLLSIGIVPLVYPYISLRRRPYFAWVIFLAIAINISGALYINSFKKDLISPMKIASMEWIKNTLPEGRVVIIQNNLTVMKTFSQTEFILDIPHRNLYTDITVFNQLLEDISAPAVSTFHARYREYLVRNNKRLGHLSSLNPHTSQDLLFIKNELKNLVQETSDLAQQIPSGTLKRDTHQLKNIYIYYAQQEEENLYATRPYYQKEPTINTFVFDNDKRFEKIYNDQEHRIFIWKFNP